MLSDPRHEYGVRPAFGAPVNIGSICRKKKERKQI